MPGGTCGVIPLELKGEGGRCGVYDAEASSIETHVADLQRPFHPPASTHRQLTNEQLVEPVWITNPVQRGV